MTEAQGVRLESLALFFVFNLVLIKLEPGFDENGKPTIIGDSTDFVTLGVDKALKFLGAK